MLNFPNQAEFQENWSTWSCLYDEQEQYMEVHQVSITEQVLTSEDHNQNQ